ncbi:MAG: polyprenol monophosphomannose synthase [Candidatus Marinimicrobia bacterium]|jgi:dolichol-phosphate mannosyltransferase|nr:polyprenol monophosphomannose synthase [Candidatus Neomarinimicrobiota bacterium]MBT3945652.1 polyprenol monophosphomannose synthase [Candidatus Neomarinimicrobiota bacterium]MBT4154312.1 polyprenol monophosphomannose synthase [Candidatus Neomarinimicrobiota bacterium]MBT4555831.1 polyprenol monophosphomannose synthase [Candidatus Neomarinimicrobiota bacterium]MBT4752399.1 polyprenol monophosphomannose synthase [Candidatus Neomarinimicrobiota bacterium]|tara:strand:- start:13029 stop:13742 length:714 start_codon:yes stop_codon:yes gene_type:complete
MKTLIISPTYNESKNIKSLVEQVLGPNPNFHLLVVDDNSPDGTAAKVRDLQKMYPTLYLEERPGKMGLGTAYIFGFKWALKNDYEAIVQMDADLSHDPKDVPILVGQLAENDLVIGSRYINGVSVVNWPISRLILSYGANMYSQIVTGMPINDGTGGFKAWRSSLLKQIDFNKIRSQGYSFQIEMNFRAWRKDARIKEEPIIFHDRTIGESKMSKSIMYEAIWMVWRLRIWKIFGWN